jgi:hypothetical protein
MFIACIPPITTKLFQQSYTSQERPWREELRWGALITLIH